MICHRPTSDLPIARICLTCNGDLKKPKRQHKPRCPACKKSMKRLYDRSGGAGSGGFKTFPAYGCRPCGETLKGDLPL